jgi:hypothetical protein
MSLTRRRETPFVLELPSDHRFFGLNFDYNQKVYEQIFDLCFYGQGGFQFNDLMAMPVTVRSFYYMKLGAILEERNKQIEAANSK